MLPVETIFRWYKPCYKLGKMSIVPINLETVPLFRMPVEKIY